MINPWRGLKNLPHNLWILSFTTLINRAGMMALPFLTLYLTKEMKVSTAAAGLAVTFYGIGALVTSPFMGKLCDKINPLTIMKLSLIISGGILFIYPFINTYLGIIILTFTWSVISEAFRPASMVLISNESDPAKIRMSFALYRLAINVGMSIGPFVGGFLAMISFNALFYMNGLANIAAAIFLIYSKWENNSHQIFLEETKNQKAPEVPVYKDFPFLYFFIGIIPVTIVFFQFSSTLPLFIVDKLGFLASVVGLTFAVNTILVIAIEVPLTDKISNWSFRKSLFLSSILCAIGFGGMYFVTNLTLLFIAVIFFTFGEMLLFPVTASYVSQVAPINKKGVYMGMYQTTFNIALTIAPWIGTLTIDKLGFSSLWIGSFLLASISAVMMLFIKEVVPSGKSH